MGATLRRFDWTKLVDRFADHIENAAKRRFAHGNGDLRTLVDDFHAADHAFGRLHRNAANTALADVLLHFEDDVNLVGDVEAFAHHAQRLVDRRHGRFFKLHVDGGGLRSG